MKNVVIRSISGAVYVALVIAAIFCGTWSFFALTLLFAVFALRELQVITLPENAKFRPFADSLDITGAFLLIACPVLGCVCSFQMAIVCATCYVIYIIARLITELYAKDTNPVMSLARSFLGQVYIVLPLALMQLLYINSIGSPQIVLAMFVMIWINDTGAFCVGSMIGKNRLFERISPKKSWEGFWGGMIFCVLVSLMMYFTFDSYFGYIGILPMIVFGVLVSVFATFGDLVESMIKRTVGVKDSGSIMPGHGGILDRIDSLLVVVPALLCFFSILEFF